MSVFDMYISQIRAVVRKLEKAGIDPDSVSMNAVEAAGGVDAYIKEQANDKDE